MSAYAERFVSAPDGLKLFVRDYAAVGLSRGAPVLCLHGLTRNSADFEAVAPRLAARGRRVLVPDMRGRGRSDRDPQPGRYRPDVYVRDVLHILDTLDVPQAVFIGTSMGGLIAMLLASLAPERIAAAVLNDVGPVVNAAGLARIADYVGQSGPFASWQAVTNAIRSAQGIAFPDADEDFWNVFARRTARERPDGTIAFDYDPAIANAFSTPAGPPPDLMPLFSALAVKPLLVVRGALSDILAPEGVEAMRAVKPDLQFVEIPRVGHAPTLEEPEAASALETFLAQIA